MKISPRIGMDIGGTKIEAVSLDSAGNVEATVLVPTVPGPEAVLASITEVVSRLAHETGREISEFGGIGIGIPGQVDRATGTVRNAYNMGVTSLALGPEVTARTGVQTAVDNDVNAAAIGATHIMGATGVVAYLNFGTGLAAGIVIDGVPFRGANGYAGEIGHLAIDARGRLCKCGQRGCLETLASGTALKEHWAGAGEHPGRVLMGAIADGDEAAKHAFELLVEGAATSIRVLGLALNPDSIVIGGGLRLLGDPLIDGIRAALEVNAAESEFVAALRLSERIQVLPADSPAAAVGAALAAAGKSPAHA